MITKPYQFDQLVKTLDVVFILPLCPRPLRKRLRGERKRGPWPFPPIFVPQDQILLLRNTGSKAVQTRYVHLYTPRYGVNGAVSCLIGWISDSVPKGHSLWS